MTDQTIEDSSNPTMRPDQAERLLTMDPRDVAAVLAMVFTGREVRIERPKTADERARWPEDADIPAGGTGLVTDVRVDETARVQVDWDWGMSDRVVPGDPYTFWVLTPCDSRDPLAYLPDQARERLMKAATDRVRKHVDRLPERGSDVEQWLERMVTIFRPGERRETAEAILAVYRRHADMHEELGGTPLPDPTGEV